MGNSHSFFHVERMSHGSHSTDIPQKIANKVVTCWYHNRSDIFFSLPFYMLIRIDPGSNLPGTHLETVSTALTCDWLYFKNTRLVPGTKLNNYIMSWSHIDIMSETSNRATSFMLIVFFITINRTLHSSSSSWQHQQFFPCDQWSWCAGHVHADPSNDEDRDGHGSSSTSRDLHEACFQDYWQVSEIKTALHP